MQKYFFPIFLVPLMLFTPPAYSQTIVDGTYINTRFHYTFTLPEGFGHPSESDNSDGIDIEAENGKALLRVWTHGIPLTDGFLSEIQQYFDGVKIWARTRDWHIETSDLNDKYGVWYLTKENQKLYNFTIPYCDSGMTNIALMYDISEEQHYAALIPILEKSLKILPKACQAAPPIHNQTIVDNTYINTRFHYTFTLPEGFGEPLEAGNGGGMLLKAKNGKAELRIWTNYIILTDSFLSETQQYFNWTKENNWHIDTSEFNDKYGIWHATRDNQKLYNFTILYCDIGMSNIELVYDISEEQHYAALIPTLAKSLKILPKACQ